VGTAHKSIFWLQIDNDICRYISVVGIAHPTLAGYKHTMIFINILLWRAILAMMVYQKIRCAAGVKYYQSFAMSNLPHSTLSESVSQ
jgi:hypothetical protein